jgi:hydroxyethylthiazole kinase-like uncharacterized protein yjeF
VSDIPKWHELLPKIKTDQYKYERGYVLIWAGSLHMPGAAMLCSMGALRGGAGIVRLFHHEDIALTFGSAPWEIIREPLMDADEVLKEAQRAGAFLLGPGLGRHLRDQRLGRKLIEKCPIPLVLDADGLLMLPNIEKIPTHTILTPHRGEICHVIGEFDSQEKMTFKAQEWVEKTGATLLCKGAPNILFHPGVKPLLLPVGNPGMATAGSGDVLSGILAAMLAQKMPAYEAAIAAVCLHGKAGDIAAKNKGIRSMIASDILDALPEAYV